MYFNYFLKNNNLDNKIIYLIANNKELKKRKNILKINNINLGVNSIIIRFNGDPLNLSKIIFVNKCDVMFYRSHPRGSFNNFYQASLKNYKTTVFTKFTKNNNIELSESFKIMLDKIDLENYYYAYLSNKNSKLSPTTGFGVLESIVENIDYKKIVLIGFSNLTKKNVPKNENYGVHSVYHENKYFQNDILKKYKNIETICC